MKVAIACEDGQVSLHFGRCPEYRIYEVEDGRIVHEETLPNPGHEPGFLPGFLASRGVGCIIAGGMGPRAAQLFESNRVRVITGAYGRVGDVIRSHLAGHLAVGESSCDHEAHEGHEPKCSDKQP